MGREYQVVEVNQTGHHRITWAWITLVVCALFVLFKLRNLATNFAIAFLIAYLLNPVLVWMKNRGVRRSFAIASIVALVIVITSVLIAVVLPIVIEELIAFIKFLPELLNRSYKWFEGFLQARFSVTLPESLTQAVQQLKGSFQKNFDFKLLRPATQALRFSLENIVNLLLSLLNIVLIPALAGFLLSDFDKHMASLKQVVPPRIADALSSRSETIESIFRSFFRGQLTVSVLMMILYSFAYSLIGVPMAIAVGVLSGLGQFIPYVGPAIGFLLGLALLLSDLNSWVQLLSFFAAYFAVQSLESWFLTPKIVGTKLGLSFTASLVSLMVFGQLFGFLGILLAIPLGAVLKLFSGDLLKLYQDSSFYCGSSSAKS